MPCNTSVARNMHSALHAPNNTRAHNCQASLHRQRQEHLRRDRGGVEEHCLEVRRGRGVRQRLPGVHCAPRPMDEPEPENSCGGRAPICSCGLTSWVHNSSVGLSGTAAPKPRHQSSLSAQNTFRWTACLPAQRTQARSGAMVFVPDRVDDARADRGGRAHQNTVYSSGYTLGACHARRESSWRLLQAGMWRIT